MREIRTEKVKRLKKKEDKKIFDVIDFSVKAHKGRFRRFSRVPAIIHSLNVAKRLAEKGCSDDIIIAAILHDTVEDTDVTLKEIKKKFGEEIAEIVEGVTELEIPFAWEKSKKHTIEHLKTAKAEVLLITCSDKLDNILSIRRGLERIGEDLWGYMVSPKEKQKWYYKTLVNVLEKRLKEEPGLSLFKRLKEEVKKVFG